LVYCDFAVTENHWRPVIQHAGIDEQYGTVVLNGLRDLAARLL
jgi:hypothetical protein